MSLTQSLLTVLGLTIAACLSVAHGGEPASSALRALTLPELVAALQKEGPTAQSARIESNLDHLYDVTVEEILRRRDVSVVTLLLDRVNDETVVRGSDGVFLWGCRYDTPVRVKYKVRFVLLRMLDPGDFNAMIGDATSPEVDVGRARRYLKQHVETIATRLR